MKKLLFLILVLGWGSDFQVFAQKPISSKDFFSSDSILDITITTDLNAILRKKIGEDSLVAHLTCASLDGTPISENVLIMLRGNSRRELCKIPPVKLNFIKSKNSKLHKLKSLKIVNPCEDNNTFQELIAKEYLIYKMYNEITDLSFKVRLAKITYKDTLEKRRSVIRYCFFIEDIDELAKRNDSKELNDQKIVAANLKSEQLDMVCLFQFMIANTDWGLPNGHNTKFIRTKNKNNPETNLIPYDFDHSGLVNAPYALPTMSLGIEMVTTRYFFSAGQSIEQLLIAYQPLKEKKEIFMDLITNCELLTRYTKNDMKKYLSLFFDIMENKNDMNYYFIKKPK